jgi:hypothetical protein
VDRKDERRKKEEEEEEEEEGEHSETKDFLPLKENNQYTGWEPVCPQRCCMPNCRI